MARVVGIPISSLLLSLTVLVNAFDSEDYEHLDAALHHYDTLHTKQINHSYTRSSASLHHRHVQFHTLERHFHLSLVPNNHVFSKDFGAHVVGEDGELRPVPLDKEEFYHGYLHGDELSSVTVHISKAGVMTGSIITQEEIYHIEPSHHYISEPHPFHMIAYKSSHVKDRLHGRRVDYATGPTLPVKESLPVLEKSNFHSGQTGHTGAENQQNRVKRQNVANQLPGGIAGLACPTILVADFRVFNRFGMDERSVIVQLVQLMDSIDRIIFRPTSWIVDTTGTTVSNLGIEIRNVTVHSVSSDSSDTRTSYNQEKPNLDAADLLNEMRFGNWDGFCLAHLFTNIDFPSGLLGLANIASPFASQTGGICSRAFRDFGFDKPRYVIYNTGVSTFNNNGQLMLMSELIRVTGHELGHNWGSHHDPPGDPACMTRWLMNEFAQDGTEQSHMEFSPCSSTSIGQVLLTKGTCFTNPETCGNFEVDFDEACDAGPEGDDCCDRQCHLVSGARCSDVNQPCCKNCSFAGDDVICRMVGNISVNCYASTMCNGMSPDCPEESPPAAEGTACIGPGGGGVCRLNVTSGRTECVSLCAVRGQTPCVCADPDECMVCCKDASDRCRPALADNNATLPLSNGADCSRNRVCINGQCTDTTQDLIERIWSIIVNLDINAFARFVGENIVGFTLIFSIPIWCIGSCLTHCCIDLDGFTWMRSQFKSILLIPGEEEEVDFPLAKWGRNANHWFRVRMEHYRRRLASQVEEFRGTDSLSEPLLGEHKTESHYDEVTASNDELLPLHSTDLPGSPVDDLPAPIYSHS